MKPLEIIMLIIGLFAVLLFFVWLVTITHSWLLISFECLAYVGITWLTIAIAIAPVIDEPKYTNDEK